jgi:4-aminobutyrate aminotransferase
MTSHPGLDHLSPVWSHSFPLIADHGEGAYLFDTDNRRYLDFTSSLAVTNTGHAHPRVVAAIREQAGKLIHGMVNVVYTKPLLDLVQALLPLMPPSLDSFFFCNSGAEAIEASVKLAKQVTRKPNVIVFQGSFHGRTHLAMSMTTSKTIYRSMYQPLVPGIFVAPYPYGFYYGWDEAAVLEFSLRELRRLLKTQTSPEETACIVVEPVLGEGGYVVPPQGFLPALRQICDENKILLIADEIQTGFGRTGKFFAVEHTRTIPDVLVMAKGIASGLPLAGIAAQKGLMAQWKTGSHGGTFGGNVIACAAALATIAVLQEEGLVRNAELRGEQLRQGLRALQAEFPVIGEVRGLGLMTAAEFGAAGAPDAATTKAVHQAAFERGLLLLTCGTSDNVIRWIPPLVVTPAQIDDALKIFAAALDSA